MYKILLTAIAITIPATAQANVLRFSEIEYMVPLTPGDTMFDGLFTTTIVYDLEAGVVGDNFFDVTVSVNPAPGTGVISIDSVSRSTAYLYDNAVSGGGVFNIPSVEFSNDGITLSANQGANSPIPDMDLLAGTYAYADVTFAISAPKGSVFDLTFSNEDLDDEQAFQRNLSSINSRIIVPEPASLSLLALSGMASLLRRRRSVL